MEQLKIDGRNVLRRGANSEHDFKGTLVLLHGYGADEYDLMGLSPYFEPDLDILSIRGPGQTPYGGASWFDIDMLSDGSLKFNVSQAQASCDGVITLIDQLKAEGVIKDEKIILAGFSQGASISNLITLNKPDLIRALLLMSGRLTEGVELLTTAAESLKGLPVFAGHGTMDQVIPIDYGRKIVSFWESLPVNLDHHEYAMGHEINQEELTHIQNWFEGFLI